MILRDKSRMTRMFILLSILQGKRKLKEIAQEIGITIQAVSEHLKVLESDGYVEDSEITLKGLEFLTQAVEEIGDFLARAQEILMQARTVEAVAGEDIEEGSEVGLFMQDGYLHAYKKRSSSMGTAINSARKGEDVGVRNLRGILKINYGKITVYALPSVEEGGSRAVDIEKLKSIIESHRGDLIGICGVVPHVLIKKLTRVDMEYSTPNAAVDAYYRGLSSALFVSHEMLPHVLQILSQKGVKYKIEKI